MKKLRVFTAFSGIGSPEAALKKLNIPHEIVAAVEIDKYARESYKAIHNATEVLEDFTKIDFKQYKDIDLGIFGFPCQAFSIAGNRLGFEEARGTLFFNVAEFIRDVKPKIFILENVKGLLSHDNGKTFDTIKAILTDGGGTVNGQSSIPFYDDGLSYHIHYKVLNTKDHGIPQNRERIFIIGFKDYRDYNFPTAEPLELRLKDMLQDDVDKKYYLSDKTINKLIKHKNPIIKNDTPSIKVNSNTLAGYEIATDGDSISIANANSKTRRGRVGKQVAQTIDTTNSLAVLQLNQSKESGGKQPYQQNRIYDIKGLSPALNTIWNVGNIINTTNIRRLTPLECWRLQGFSDADFYKAAAVNSDTQLYKQAGNSITVDVIEKVIKQLNL